MRPDVLDRDRTRSRHGSAPIAAPDCCASQLLQRRIHLHAGRRLQRRGQLHATGPTTARPTPTSPPSRSRSMPRRWPSTDSYTTGEDTPLTITLAGSDAERCGPGDHRSLTGRLTATLGAVAAPALLSANADGGRSPTRRPPTTTAPTASRYRVNDGASTRSDRHRHHHRHRRQRRARRGQNDSYSDGRGHGADGRPARRAGQRHRRGRRQPDRGAGRRGPAHGTLTLNANGSFTYTPDANYNGTDSFTYQANDGTADSQRRHRHDHRQRRSTMRRWRSTTATAPTRTRR